MNFKRKKLKIVCLMLAIAMMFSMSVPIMAVEEIDEDFYYELPQQIIDIMNGSDDLIDYFNIYDTPVTDPNSLITPAWSGAGRQATHQYITASALSAFYSDMPNHVSFAMYGSTYWQILMSASDLPDHDSWDARNVYEGHFYDAYGGVSYTGSTTNTARQNFVNYYASAVAYYRSGDYTTAYTFLGKSLHYIQDLSNPHHAANLVAGLTNHAQFEDYIDVNRTNYWLFSIPTSTYNSSYNQTTGSVAQSAAYYAYGYALTVVNSNSHSVWEQVGQATVPKAIENTACVIYRFAKDVGII